MAKRHSVVVNALDYFSVCSGIEAATAAWHALGWKATGFSEIEDFPRAALKHHYPDVQLHGDFTKMNSVPTASVLVGGTPCQDFSIAGLRAGMDGKRGNLTLEFLRLADGIDAARSDGGQPPCIVVWENVPGVFSDKKNAFGCFLAGLVGDDEPLAPFGGRWTDSGMVAGPKRRAAWRVLDAQYFGLAQRRQRVFVVASARDDFDPAAVLFEPEGVRRHHPPSRQAGEGSAPGAAPGTGGGGLAKSLAARPHMAQHEDKDTLIPAVANTLGGASQSGGFRTTDLDNQGAFIPEVAPTMSGDDRAMGRTLQTLPIVAPTLVANGNRTGGDRPPGTDGDTVTSLLPIVMGSGQANAEIDTDRAPTLTLLHEAPIVSHALQTQRGLATEDGTGRGSPLVAEAFKPSHYTRGKDGAPSETAPPLSADADKGDQDTLVAFSCKDSGQDAGEISPTLRAQAEIDGNANGGSQVAVAFESRIARNGRGKPEEIVPPLKAQSGETGKGDGAPLVALPFDTTQLTHPANRSSPRPGDPSHPLASGAHPPSVALGELADPVAANQARTYTREGAHNFRMSNVAISNWAVRRLTPRECERLQGFPDDYTLIPYGRKTKWKLGETLSDESTPVDKGPRMAADGPRYKALGNSMAVPVMRWLGRRIQAEIEKGKRSP